jgi:hypothetical protein
MHETLVLLSSHIRFDIFSSSIFPPLCYAVLPRYDNAIEELECLEFLPQLTVSETRGGRAEGEH